MTQLLFPSCQAFPVSTAQHNMLPVTVTKVWAQLPLQPQPFCKAQSWHCVCFREKKENKHADQLMPPGFHPEIQGNLSGVTSAVTQQNARAHLFWCVPEVRERSKATAQCWKRQKAVTEKLDMTPLFSTFTGCPIIDLLWNTGEIRALVLLCIWSTNMKESAEGSIWAP